MVKNRTLLRHAQSGTRDAERYYPGRNYPHTHTWQSNKAEMLIVQQMANIARSLRNGTGAFDLAKMNAGAHRLSSQAVCTPPDTAPSRSSHHTLQQP